jgi:antibiotic biosynthesis monooxygenase (ABM) superfamily enzyme
MVNFITEEREMVKVIEGYELKKGADIQSLFLRLRSYAMTFPGFISVEHICSVKGTPIAALLYNWDRIENWKAWESAKLRQQILQEAEAFLVSKPRITIYTVMPTSAWTYNGYKS